MKVNRTTLLRASALSVAVAALATACSSSNSASTSTSTSASSSSSGSVVAASGSDLLIGTIGNFSGPSAQPDHLAGLQAWVDSVNASGGIKGHQVKLVVEDDQGDATQSQADIRQLVQVDHVLAIVSPEASGTESGWASYVQQQHVAVIGGENDTPVWFTNPSFFPSGSTVLTSLEMQAYAVKAAGKDSFGAVYCAEIAACKQIRARAAGLREGISARHVHQRGDRRVGAELHGPVPGRQAGRSAGPDHRRFLCGRALGSRRPAPSRVTARCT